MISIGRLSNATAAADYYLQRQADCQGDYYTGIGERRGAWLGQGATALGLVGELTSPDEETFRALLAGRHPDATVLAAPVLRVDPRSRLDARPLLAAVRAANPARLGEPWPAFDSLARHIQRSPLASVTVRADAAVAIATAAGLDARKVYGDVGLSLDEALAHLEERIDIRRPGYDVVFSAPKSVSVAYGLGANDTSREVRQAHASAVGQAMRYLELFVARSTQGHHGDGHSAPRVATEGLVAAAFEHRCSRADDPQLHTHVVIANLIRRSDGQWSAIDSAALYHHMLTAGYIYQAILRAELTRRLGVQWTPVRRGVAEITAIPQGLCRAFSQRRQAIEARLAARGQSGRIAAQQACLHTRPAKPHTPEATQRERWRERALQAGFDPEQPTTAPPLPMPREIDANRIVAMLTGPDGLTAKRSTFDPRDVVRGVCETIPGGTSIDLDGLLELGRTVVRSQDVVALLHSAWPGERTYSTTDMLTAEAQALAIVEDRRTAAPAVPDPKLVEALLSKDTLVGEQAELVRRLTTSPAGVDVIVGPAGAGKTRALRVARQAWQASGHQVLGASLAAVAAQELQRGSGIASSSLTRFLTRVKRDGLPTGSVVVVDEASMIGTRQLLRIMEATQAAAAKLVLVGDPCQLCEIEAGGLFAALARSDQTLQLTANQRQAQAWERDALSALRDGDPRSALDAYAEHDRIRLAADHQQLLDRLAADYLMARSEPGEPDVLVLAARNSDVRAVNDAVRARLRDHDLLGPEDLHICDDEHPRAFAVGDEVVVTRNNYRLELFNGTRARVTAIDTARRSLSLATRDGHEVQVPAKWVADSLQHGYAMTCHRAQGITVDVALLYGTAALSREAAYVAMSRGRQANYVYATHEEIRDYDECGLDQHGQEPDEATGLATQALGAAIARSSRQRLAQDHGPAIRLGVAVEQPVPLIRAS
jgi:conjugative relaxase-like TrwC/TraI family protein